ncbi:MAG: hypothetical protein GY737_04040 [Desulfobacteraceae bacterium]|nr:hypothetical protein [Desulfobacteraceae bacterium]
MIRTVISFAAGFAVAKLTADSKIIKKTKECAAENYEKVKSASKKVAGVVKDEFSSKEEGIEKEA